MDAPRLSVIIASYNRVDLFRVCLQSLVDSGVENMEIVVVDDGSTISPEEMVRTEFPQVKYFSQTNHGQAYARNVGYAKAKGKYIVFVDCDDAWYPGVATEILDFLDRESDVDAVFSETHVGNEEEGYFSMIGAYGGEEFLALPHRAEGKLRVLAQSPFFQQLMVRNALCISGVIMRREAFEQIGMFDPQLQGSEDWELWLRMASRMTFAFFRDTLALYRRHDNCMSNKHDLMGEQFAEALQRIDRHCDYLTDAERKHLRRRLRHHLFGQAYNAFDRGEFSLAHDRFTRLSKSFRLRMYERAMWKVCKLPRPLVSSLRRVKQTLAR